MVRAVYGGTLFTGAGRVTGSRDIDLRHQPALAALDRYERYRPGANLTLDLDLDISMIRIGARTIAGETIRITLEVGLHDSNAFLPIGRLFGLRRRPACGTPQVGHRGQITVSDG